MPGSTYYDLQQVGLFSSLGENVLLRSIIVILSFVFLLPGVGSALEDDKPGSQVVVEVGLAIPYGELGADFEKTRLGLGATQGLEIGFSYRIFLSSTVSIAPTFLFLDYGSYNGFDEEVGDFQVQSSSYRYGAELMVKMPGPHKKPRPFLAVGAGLYRNRVTGFYQDYTKALDQSVNTMGYSLRAGVQIIGLEFSVVYNINRFNTWQFYQSDYRERYNWDNVSIRAGWLIPFGEE